MDELEIWNKESETKTELEKAGVLNIAKKISREFRDTIHAYVANYWDCGWIRSADILTEKEKKKLEKALTTLVTVKHEVPYLYKGEEYSTFGQIKHIYSVNRYTGTCCIERYDKNNKLLSMKIDNEIPRQAIMNFFNSIRCVEKYEQTYDLYNKHLFVYPLDKKVTEVGLIEDNYRDRTITISELFEKAGLN